MGGSIRVHREGPDLFLVRQDGDEELVAVSISPVGSLIWFVLLVLGIGLGTLLFAYVVGMEWLRKYFIPQRGRPISLAKALASGEGPNVEFKHGLTEDAVLRAITASPTRAAERYSSGSTMRAVCGDLIFRR